MGLCGWLAAWADPATVLAANPNLYLFYGLEDTIDRATGLIQNGMGVTILLMAVILNAGTIDSLQNGLLTAFSSLTALGIDRTRKYYPHKVLSPVPLMALFGFQGGMKSRKLTCSKRTEKGDINCSIEN